MKLQLSRTASDIFVIFYLLGTLLLRFLLEPQFQGNALVSVGIGAFALLFLWALQKSEYIQPSWFGLLPKQQG
ncbi:MAG: hypothetical protein AAGJ82_00555 [Bacteroidota bacterium]